MVLEYPPFQQAEAYARVMMLATPEDDDVYDSTVLLIVLLLTIPKILGLVLQGVIGFVVSCVTGHHKIVADLVTKDSTTYQRYCEYVSYFNAVIYFFVSGLAVVIVSCVRGRGVQSHMQVTFASLGGLLMANAVPLLLEHAIAKRYKSAEYGKSASATDPRELRIHHLNQYGIHLKQLVNIAFAFTLTTVSTDAPRYNQFYFWAGVLLLCSVTGDSMEPSMRPSILTATTLPAYILIMIAGITQSYHVALPSWLVPFQLTRDAGSTFLIFDWALSILAIVLALIAFFYGIVVPKISDWLGGNNTSKLDTGARAHSSGQPRSYGQTASRV